MNVGIEAAASGEHCSGGDEQASCEGRGGRATCGAPKLAGAAAAGLIVRLRGRAAGPSRAARSSGATGRATIAGRSAVAIAPGPAITGRSAVARAAAGGGAAALLRVAAHTIIAQSALAPGPHQSAGAPTSAVSPWRATEWPKK